MCFKRTERKLFHSKKEEMKKVFFLMIVSETEIEAMKLWRSFIFYESVMSARNYNFMCFEVKDYAFVACM